MRHYPTELNPLTDHYAVGMYKAPDINLVLIQLMEDAYQARIALTPNEARHLAQLLIDAADKVSK